MVYFDAPTGIGVLAVAVPPAGQSYPDAVLSPHDQQPSVAASVVYIGLPDFPVPPK